MLKSGSSLKKKTKEEILTYDFKEYPINDLKIGDKSLLNLKHYTDNDIKNYNLTIKERRNLLLTLRTRNRKYNKEHINEIKKS